MLSKNYIDISAIYIPKHVLHCIYKSRVKQIVQKKYYPLVLFQKTFCFE